MLFQLLFFSLLLAVVGEPLRILVSHYTCLFRRLSVLQIYVLDIYLGGLILYIIAMIPLHLFTSATTWILTITSGILSIFLHLKKFKITKSSVRSELGARTKIVSGYLVEHKGVIIESVIVLAMFLVVLWIQIMPVTKFIFGSIHDTSLHALLVELILENQQVPATHQPYLPSPTVYPQASHVIFAYSSYVLGYIPPKAVFYISPLFIAMSVLGGYYFGKKIHPTEYLGVNLAFIIAFVSMWPRYITWGSNPFIIGFPLFFINLSLLPSLSSLNLRKKIGEIIIIGILFGYSASIHLSFYEVLIVSMILWSMVKVFHKPMTIYIKLRDFFFIFIFSLLLIAPFLYRFIRFYAYQGRAIGLPQPPIAPAIGNFFNQLFSNFSINPVPLLRYLWVGLCITSIVTLPISLRKRRELFIIEKIALTTFVACMLLMFYVYFLPTFGIHWGRISLLGYVSVEVFIATFNTRLYSILNKNHINFFGKLLRKPRAIIAARFTLTLLIFSALYAPFMYDALSQEPQRLVELYGSFAVTMEDDYELMMWMKRGISQNVTVLINPYEPGTFIPSISDRKVVFPFSAYQRSRSYRRLINSIQQGVLNETTYALMKKFNVTHVFVGSKATHWWKEDYKWNPVLFLTNPNFKLVKKIGNSYLFEVHMKI